MPFLFDHFDRNFYHTNLRDLNMYIYINIDGFFILIFIRYLSDSVAILFGSYVGLFGTLHFELWGCIFYTLHYCPCNSLQYIHIYH